MLFSAAISSHNPLLTSMAEPYKDLAIRAVRYQTDREEKRIAFVVGGIAVARTTFLVVVVVPEMVVVRATVIKIARAIIILKPAFLVVPSPGRWSRRQEAAEGWWNDRGEGRPARALRGGHR